MDPIAMYMVVALQVGLALFLLFTMIGKPFVLGAFRNRTYADKMTYLPGTNKPVVDGRIVEFVS
jgi:hypothetical protein